MTLVVDTSVVLKWFLPEEASLAARALISRALVAPSLMRIELANALCSAVRRGQLSPLQASLSLAEATSMVSISPMDVSARALEIALTLSHPAYDCVFLALAELLDTVVVTADARLGRACAGTAFADLLQPL